MLDGNTWYNCMQTNAHRKMKKVQSKKIFKNQWNIENIVKHLGRNQILALNKPKGVNMLLDKKTKPKRLVGGGYDSD